MAETDLRVLVVDDERSIRRFLKASLGSQFVILEATNGEEASAPPPVNIRTSSFWTWGCPTWMEWK